MIKTPLSLLLTAGLALPAAAAKTPKPAKSPAPVSISTSLPFALPLFPPTTAAITVPLAIERFAQFDRQMRTLTAVFRQSVRSDDTGQTQAAEGTFAYRKDNLLRLEHRLPDPQTLVCDGSRVWVWRPANGQVIRSTLEDWKRSQPLAQGLLDFGNYAGLLKRYDVSVGTVSAAGPDGHRGFSLVLKPLSRPRQDKAGDFTLTLRLSTRDFFPFDSELRVGGVTAHSVFADVRFNPELPETLFRFSPPPDADVLDFPASPPLRESSPPR